MHLIVMGVLWVNHKHLAAFTGQQAGILSNLSGCSFAIGLQVVHQGLHEAMLLVEIVQNAGKSDLLILALVVSLVLLFFAFIDRLLVVLATGGRLVRLAVDGLAVGRVRRGAVVYHSCVVLVRRA